MIIALDGQRYSKKVVKSYLYQTQLQVEVVLMLSLGFKIRLVPICTEICRLNLEQVAWHWYNYLQVLYTITGDGVPIPY